MTGTQPGTGLALLAASRVRLGLGGNRFAGPDALGPATDPQACRDVIRMACDRGLSVIDTADCYGPGFSEELIGAALQGMSERPPVATKVGVVRGSRGEWVVDVCASHLERSARASARRLRTDTIDVLQLHHPSKHSDIRDQVAPLHKLRECGFVRHIGVCNVNLDQLRRAEEAGPLVSVQNHLHLRRMTSDELQLIEYCEGRGIAYLAYQPLAEGMLLNDPAVREAAREAGTTPAGLALGRLLGVASNVVPLVGTARPTHLLENVNAVVPFDAALRVGGGSSVRPLTQRRGGRPTTSAGVPHQQLDGNSPLAVRAEVIDRAVALGLVPGPSRVSVPGAVGLFHASTEEGLEVGHVHPSYDGSLHVVLDIESARQVVATGRGEFHPAAARGLPPGTVMVYAPLDRLDVEDCLSILEAAHAYASSVAGHVVHRPALTWPAAPEPAPAVCVVGSGEVACALALRLAQSGIDTRLARGTEWPVARRLPVGMDRPLLEALDGAGTVVICVSIDTALKLAHRYPAFAGDRVVIDVTLPSADGSASPRSRSIALARAIPYARLVGGLDEIRTASGGSSAVDLLAQTRVYSDDSSAKGLLTALLKRSGVIAVDDGLLAGCDEPEPER